MHTHTYILGLILSIYFSSHSLAHCNVDNWNALQNLYSATDGANWTGIDNSDWGTSNCRVTDSLALVSFYDSLGGGQNWTYDWDLTQPMNTWAGITLNNNGCVKKIIMTVYWNLNGMIPSEIGNLQHLETLYIRNEPNLTGDFPPEFYNLSNLLELVFVNTGLTISLTPDIQNLSSLEILQIGDSYLSGTIPEEIANMQSLRIIILQDGNLQGSIPASFSQLSNLEILNLWNNNLEGCFDSSLSVFCDTNTFISVDIGNNFDASWSDFCASNNGCCPGESCVSSIVLDDYEVCGFTHFQDKPSETFKLSGIAYNKYSSSMYVSVSYDERIYEIDTKGTLLRKIELDGFTDVESVTIIDQNTIAVSEEFSKGNIVFIDISDQLDTNDTIPYAPSSQIIHFPDLIDNSSIEGMAYDAMHDILYFAREKEENGNAMAVYRLDNPVSHLGTTITQLNVAFDIQALLTDASISNFTDITGLSITNTGSLLITSEEANAVLEVNPLSGSMLGYKVIVNFQTQKLQGITVDMDDNIYILNHSNPKFLTLKLDCQSCDPCVGPTKQLPYFEDFESDPDICHKEDFSTLYWHRHTNAIGSNYGPKMDAYLINPRPVSIDGFSIYSEFFIPCISIGNADVNPYLSFAYRFIDNVSPSTFLKVFVKTPSTNRTEIWSDSSTNTIPWTNSGHIPLNQYAGQTVSIEFWAPSQASTRIILLDNILVTAEGLINPPNPNDCPKDLFISGSDTQDLYNASETIHSIQYISGNTEYSTGQQVYLDIGFEVTDQSTFTIVIDACQ